MRMLLFFSTKSFSILTRFCFSVVFPSTVFLFVLSCGNNVHPEHPVHLAYKNVDEKLLEFTSIPDQAISISEYITWVKSQTALTYSEQENQQSKISILYKPLELEAALSNANQGNSVDGYKKLLKIKEDYHYILIESLDKIPSASNLNAGKKELLNYVKSHLTVIENETDTLSNPIIEEFPSSIINKPDQLLLLVKKHSVEKFQVVVDAKKLGLEDVKISLTKKQIESLPHIKL